MAKKLLITPPTPEEQQAAHESFMRYLRENPNNFSYWFPHIKNLTEKGISIPYSIIIPIPEEVYKAFFREEEGDAEKIDRWVTDIVSPTIAVNPLLNGRKLFIKNGTFSNKFDFSKACLIEDARDEETLIRHISNIMYDSYMHETDGYLELVVREFIEPEENTPTIYNGMPLRCEARVFYNFDTHQLLYAVNYWDWNYCHDGICFALGGERKPDADTYEKAWPLLEFKTRYLLRQHQELIEKALASVDTLHVPEGYPNIWSVDFMLEEEKVWLIDMAVGWRSAYWNPEKAGLKPKNG